MQTIISNFTQIIEDIERIFDSFKIQDTRFKQKSDLFHIGCIAGLIKDGL